jgi:hypothetical protein
VATRVWPFRGRDTELAVLPVAFSGPDLNGAGGSTGGSLPQPGMPAVLRSPQRRVATARHG